MRLPRDIVNSIKETKATFNEDILDPLRSASWFNKQEKYEEDKDYLENLSGFASSKNSNRVGIFMPLLFLLAPIAFAIATLRSPEVAESSDYILIVVLLIAFGFPSIFISRQNLKKFNSGTPDTLPGLYIEKYYRTRRKDKKTYTDYYVILEINGTKITANISQYNYKRVWDYDILWVFPEYGELTAIRDDNEYSDEEIVDLFSQYEIKSVSQANNVNIDINNLEKLNIYDSMMLINDVVPNDRFIKLLESSPEYEYNLAAEKKNLTGFAIIFPIVAILMDFGIFKSITGGNTNIPLVIIGAIFNLIAVLLVYKRLTFSQLEVGKAIQGLAIEKSLSGNSRSNANYIVFVAFEDKLVELVITRSEYNKIEEGSPVWIYKYTDKSSTIKVIPR